MSSAVRPGSSKWWSSEWVKIRGWSSEEREGLDAYAGSHQHAAGTRHLETDEAAKTWGRLWEMKRNQQEREDWSV